MSKKMLLQDPLTFKLYECEVEYEDIEPNAFHCRCSEWMTNHNEGQRLLHCTRDKKHKFTSINPESICIINGRPCPHFLPWHKKRRLKVVEVKAVNMSVFG